MWRLLKQSMRFGRKSKNNLISLLDKRKVDVQKCTSTFLLSMILFFYLLFLNFNISPPTNVYVRGDDVKSKIILVFILLLAICSITSAAASDNITESDQQIADDIKVSFNDTVYRQDLGSIDVEIPQNVTGNLRATINDVEFYNKNVTSSVSVPITIPHSA